MQNATTALKGSLGEFRVRGRSGSLPKVKRWWCPSEEAIRRTAESHRSRRNTR
jgi:hypothetical protein